MQNTQTRRRPRGCTRMMIYDFINDYTARRGYPPTIREIGDAVGVSSSGTVARHLKSLQSDCMIQRWEHHARAIRTQQDQLL